MTAVPEVFVLVELPGGRVGAFTAAAVAAARERAEGLGYGLQPAAAEPAGPLMTSGQMAALLGCNDTLVEQMAKDRRIPSIRVGGKLLRFEAQAVLKALREAGP